MAERCGVTTEGPKSHGTRRNIRMWRGTCKAFPMRAPEPPIDGFMPRRCFQHQPSEVRAEVYRRRDADRRREVEEYRRVHGHFPGEVGRG